MVDKLKIPYFRGVFCLDTLPKKIRANECAIVNLDKSDGSGTHWISYVKKKDTDTVLYFDSFGNLRPPIELRKYFEPSKILYNFNQHQTFGSVNCGHLSLRFLVKQYEQ